MTDERPPTYDELVHDNLALKDKVASLGSYARRLESLVSRQAAEINAMKRRKQRTLDPNSASAFDRPYR